jgi:hypothetical protein
VKATPNRINSECSSTESAARFFTCQAQAGLFCDGK